MRHFILLSSCYSKGCRIALDFYEDEKINQVKEVIKKIKDECGSDVSFSSHSIEAKSESWEDVGKSDRFFADVKLIDSVDEFISLIKKDRVLSGWDVAKYILSKIKCTHLKLEKLVYLAYADYLCETKGQKLFDDTIQAYMYGPVVKSVYSHCKKYGYEEIDSESEDETFSAMEYDELSIRSRILFAEDGFVKSLSIDKTLQKYGDRTGSQLVGITHRADSPWEHTKQSETISDNTILQYHYIEAI